MAEWAVPAGDQVAIAFRHPWSVPAGDQVPLAFGPEDDPGPEPEPDTSLIVASGLRWARAPSRAATVQTGWTSPPVRDARTGAAWSAAAQRDASAGTPWRQVPPLATTAGTAWGMPSVVSACSGLRWRDLPRLAATAGTPWGMPPLRDVTAGSRWRWPASRLIHAGTPWGMPPVVSITAGSRWRLPPTRDQQVYMPWGSAPPVDWQIGSPGVVGPENPEPPRYRPPDGDRVRIAFKCPWPSPSGDEVAVQFGPAQCYWARPRPRRYIVLNSVQVVRLPERTPINVESGHIEASRDNALRSFAFDLCDPGQLALLKPGIDGQPKSVEININGHVRTGIVRTWSDVNRHIRDGGQGRVVGVSGESRAKLLDEPFAPRRSRVESETRTAVQLMEAELDLTGFELRAPASIGWDWEVPGGLWTYDGLTPLAAVRRIAEAAGAFVIAHPFDDELIVRPHYHTLPWQWSSTAADVQIDDDWILDDAGGSQLGDRDSRSVMIPLWPPAATDKPGFVEPGDLVELVMPAPLKAVAHAVRVTWGMVDAGNGARVLVVEQSITLDPAPAEPMYNQVTVSGVHAGVRDSIVRAGTAADVPLPMITDTLITEHTVARERGAQALAAGSSAMARSALWGSIVGLLPGGRRIIGNVVAANDDGSYSIATTDGGTLRARPLPGQTWDVLAGVIVVDGRIVDSAPALPGLTQEV